MSICEDVGAPPQYDQHLVALMAKGMLYRLSEFIQWCSLAYFLSHTVPFSW